jgi:hypothetical protein
MFHGLPDQNAAQRVPYKADSFVGIVRVFGVFLDLSSELHAQVLNGFIHLILNGGTHQTVSMRVVHFQVILGQLKVKVTPLVPMHKHDQVVNDVWWYSFLLDILRYVIGIVFKHDKWMLEINFLDNSVSLAVVMSLQEELIVQALLVPLNVAVKDQMALLVLHVLPDDRAGEEFEHVVVDFNEQLAELT